MMARPLNFGFSLAFAMVLSALAGPAYAHEAAGGFILLLPTDFYLIGAALAVAASFVLLAIAPTFGAGTRRISLRLPVPPATATSLMSTAFVMVLLLTGWFGPEDPLANLIPFGVWTLGWITMSIACAVFGNLWHWLNPWTGLMTTLNPDGRGLFTLPRRLGYSIAVAQFVVFVLVDLISVANLDPDRLVVYLGSYWLFNAAGMALFGPHDWCARAEPLTLYYRLAATLSPLKRTPEGRVSIGLPGARAVDTPQLPPSALAFVIFALASASFDGLIDTFRWLTLIGVNPLEFYGRSSVVLPNTIGLMVIWALWWLLFHGTVRLGCRMAGMPEKSGEMAGRLAYSLLPISVAFHIAHFLTRLIIDYQYLWKVASNPFGSGWNLFGTANAHVSTAMFRDQESVSMLWNIQTGVITLAHVMGIVMAHAVALQVIPNARSAVRSQIPFALLMVAYTAFGLWLLAAPKL